MRRDAAPATPRRACAAPLRAIRRPHAARAFTLMEVLVAAVVLGVGVVLVLEGVSGALSAGGAIDSEMEARGFAGDLLDRSAAGELAVPASGEQRIRGIPYRWQVDSLPQGPYDRVVARVSWQRRGRPRRVELERLVPVELGGQP